MLRLHLSFFLSFFSLTPEPEYYDKARRIPLVVSQPFYDDVSFHYYYYLFFFFPFFFSFLLLLLLIFSLLSLLLAEGNYQKGVNLILEWMDEVEEVTAQSYSVLGQAYFALGDYRKSMSSLETAYVFL